MRLHEIAHARAGDKGNVSDVSVFARSPEAYAWLRSWLTPAVVKDHFDGIVLGEVDRYEVPGLQALKFVMHDALAGGVTRSLALDIHGKSFSSLMLQLELPPGTELTRPEGLR